MNKRKAKIICTIGPASSTSKVISRMIKSGMDVARLNFSHGTQEFHKEMIKLVRQQSDKCKKTVSILQDLQGIKIRTGLIRDGKAYLKKGSTLSLFAGAGLGDETKLYLSYPLLLKDAAIGEKILLDDGLIILKVAGKSNNSLKAKVVEGGIISDRKGVNFPGMKISIRSFTSKDKKDLDFGITMNVDYVAMSFVRCASDVKAVKEIIKKRGKDIPVIAKIEKPSALDNIDEIIESSDGIMIARGDLGVEVPLEEVPIIQKMLIEKANNMGKIVITATQMLESMMEHSRPTRAEAGDVANAVIDSTDALMLSGETSAGKYPVEAVKMMARIIDRTEESRKSITSYIGGQSDSEAVADAAYRAGEDIGAKVIVAFSQSGFTARLVSKFRPSSPIVVFTPDNTVLKRLPLFWGVVPLYMPAISDTDRMIKEVDKLLLEKKIVRRGDRIVITASTPLSKLGKTNFMKLHRIGE